MDPKVTDDFQKRLKMVELDDRVFNASYCKVCNYDSGNITAHRKSSAHAERVQVLSLRKTLVYWDINSCPIPEGDASLVVPSIKLLLDKSGFSGGPLTITAIGDLLKLTPDVLRAISSSGVRLQHGKQHAARLFSWTRDNPPPATIMLICGGRRVKPYSVFTETLRETGYTIFLYPSMEDVLRAQQCIDRYGLSTAWRFESGEPAWRCIVCANSVKIGQTAEVLHGESIEDFTKHVESKFHKWKLPDGECTQVWWDINSCPVPHDLDASVVVESIKGLLEKSGFIGGFINITAIGDLEPTLKQTPNVLPAISSNGVLLKHVPKGVDLGNELINLTLDFTNPPPIFIVLISSGLETDSRCIIFLKDRGYTVSRYDALIKSGSEMNWQPSTAWCSDTGASAWCCMLCRRTRKHFRFGESFHGNSVEEFTKHLESTTHLQSIAMMTPGSLTSNQRQSKKRSLEDEDEDEEEDAEDIWD